MAVVFAIDLVLVMDGLVGRPPKALVSWTVQSSCNKATAAILIVLVR